MNSGAKPKLIAILGPTAVGKTDLSITLAKKLSTEIISVDSALIYKDLNIGTAKPKEEEKNFVPHHLIDIINPNMEYNVTNFVEDAHKIILKLNKEKKVPLLVGGTGLYLKALLEGYNFNAANKDIEYRNHLEDLAQKYGNDYLHNMLLKLDNKKAKSIHKNNIRRVIRALEVIHLGEKSLSSESLYQKSGQLMYDAVVFALNRPREELYHRINQRVDLMMKEELIDEVKALINKGANRNWQSMKSIGYKEVLDYIDKKQSLEELVTNIKQNSRHYAKRQITFFKKMPYIINLDISNLEKNIIIENIINKIKEMGILYEQ